METIKFHELPISKPRKSKIDFDEIIPRLCGIDSFQIHPALIIWVELCLSLAQKIEEVEGKNSKFKPSFQKITILRGPECSGKTTEAYRIINNRKFMEFHTNLKNEKDIKSVGSEIEILLFDGIDYRDYGNIVHGYYPPHIKEIIICLQS